jgi:hypothetical protein
MLSLSGILLVSLCITCLMSVHDIFKDFLSLIIRSFPIKWNNKKKITFLSQYVLDTHSHTLLSWHFSSLFIFSDGRFWWILLYYFSLPFSTLLILFLSFIYFDGEGREEGFVIYYQFIGVHQLFWHNYFGISWGWAEN